MNLVIVESPTKAKKLRSYLSSDFKIEASVGHVRDLPKKNLGIDLEHNFKPIYEVSEDKKKVVARLKQLAGESKNVYLAMDPDREGEAIAWHIKYILSNDSHHDLKFLRSTFHEITKPAVLEAINKPGKINLNLVDAQQARRVLDRLVGYKVSPVLWKKVRRGLSAGRVQSVALRLIVEREREIEKFKATEYWEVQVGLSADLAYQVSKEIFKDQKFNQNLAKSCFVVDLDKVGKKKFQGPTAGFDSEDKVLPIVKDLEGAKYQVAGIEKKQRIRQSNPPFTTSTLQQSAATRLGFSSKQTMALAQQLYEEGLITYHRTDSMNLSPIAITAAREYISKNYSLEYLPEKPRLFKSKAKNAQEAHEAIRVTHLEKVGQAILGESKKFTNNHVKLYDLIWKRFVASQMGPAIYDQTTVTVKAQNEKEYSLKAVGSIMKFDGWTRLFNSFEDTLLPGLTEGQDLKYLAINPLQKFTQPPPRYNDASIVKELEKKGIGRPSTYASIISVIQARGYVEKKEKRFFANDVGKTVNDFLIENFPDIMDYDFTAEMEEDLDRVSRGEKDWEQIVAAFWKPLEKKIGHVEEKASRVQIPAEKTGEKCPFCGATEGGEVVIRTGRFGKFRSCSRFPDCKYTENIVQKIDGVKCPLCQEGDVIARNSRWGKEFFGCSRYPNCDWASWKKPEPGDKISQKEWEVMKQMREERKKKRMAKYQGKNQDSGKKAKPKTKVKTKKKRTSKKKG